MRISDWSSDVCSSDLHEKLDRENEEGEDDQRPGEQEAGDLDEVLEERPVAHQVGDGVEQRTARVEAGLSALAGAHQVGGGKAGAGGFQAETGEALEDDARQVVPVEIGRAQVGTPVTNTQLVCRL